MDKRKKSMPDAYILVIAIILLMIMLTYIIPAGSYSYEADNKTIVADTFHYLDSKPAGISDFLNSFLRGMQSSSTTIFLVLLIGGAFQVLTDTGSIHAALSFALSRSKGSHKLIIVSIVVVMSILGALGVGNNVALAFCPVVMILCKRLRLDSLVVAGTMYLAANSGFATSPINPFTVLLAQDIAGIPQMSGLLARSVMWVIATLLIVWWTLRYCKMILADPSKSYMYAEEADSGDLKNENLEELVQIKPSHILNLLLLLGVFAVYAYGGIVWNWDLPALGAAMMVLAFGSAILGRMNPNTAVKSFVKGAQSMVYSAVLVGFASAINIIMRDAEILHTVVYYLTQPLIHLSTTLSVVGTFIISIIVNFFIPSGSGQCYVTMPILAPVADILGFSRQIVISAFQLGDGLGNAFIPTSGLLMGFLGIARVPFHKWLKYVLPFTLILALIACVFLVVMTAIGWH